MGGMERNTRDQAVKTDPFYRVENRGPEKPFVLGHKEDQDRGKAHTLGS